MAEAGLYQGIRAIDCAMQPRWPGGPSGSRSLDRMTDLLIRDPESRGYRHPAQHFFKGSEDRIAKGDTIEGVLEMMDRFGVEMALVPVSADDPEDVLKVLEAHPRRFFGKVHVNPLEGMEGLRKVEAVARGNPLIKAINVTPFAVQKPPNDKVYYPVYVKAVELDLPVTMTVGLPGPRVPGEVQNPIYLDEPLWFFPELKVVMMHGGEPWEFTCVKLMLKWPNLYYMTSAFAPRHYPKDIVQYANTRGADRIMFAGYYPGFSYERVKAELPEAGFREHVWPKFLRENAARVFRLAVG